MFQQRMPMQIYNFLITGVDGQGNMQQLHAYPTPVAHTYVLRLVLGHYTFPLHHLD